MADDEDEPSAGPQYAVNGTQRRGEVRDVHQGELAGDPIEGLICTRREPLGIVNDIGDGVERIERNTNRQQHVRVLSRAAVVTGWSAEGQRTKETCAVRRSAKAAISRAQASASSSATSSTGECM